MIFCLKYIYGMKTNSNQKFLSDMLIMQFIIKKATKEIQFQGWLSLNLLVFQMAYLSIFLSFSLCINNMLWIKIWKKYTV